MTAEYPYPNPFEILRFILRALDLKQSNKRLDELTAKRSYDPRELHHAVTQHFSGVAEKYMGKVTAELISKCVNRFFENYLYEIVGKVPADGVSRSLVLEILMKTCVKDHVTKLVQELHEKVGSPHPSTWFSDAESTVGILLKWFNENIPNWESYVSSLEKEDKDMVSSWAKGKVLPSAQSILRLHHSANKSKDGHANLAWNQIKTLLLVSRAIDLIKSEPLGPLLLNESRLALWNANNQLSLSSEINIIQTAILKKLGPDLQLIAKLQNELRRTVKKSDPDGYRAIIDQVRNRILASKHLLSTQYWIDWHDARWHVYAGELQKANELYKSAFEDALFCAGEHQQSIIEESMVVAASLPNPDRVFLKQMKWSLINFGYDIPSITGDKPSQKVSDTIEDWELDLWKANFNQIFPKAGLFPGVDYVTSQAAIGPLIFTGSFEIKPDYRYPDRKIKIGDTWKRVMPQLVWFAMNDNVEVCERLIEKGADVNVASEVGDTPILMALEALNVTAFNRSLDDRLFSLIQAIPHDAKTLNIKTQKKRLLPIISAVESGRLEVVKAVLDMGADPNHRGTTDEQTGLNVCLKLIGILKNPELCKKHQLSMPTTPELLDSIRRQAHGMSGFTMEHQERFLEQSIQSELFGIFADQYVDLMNENIHQHMNISQMREIAKLLINTGADVNTEHASPVKGYTPLMLAAELDERELFDAMLIAGGDIKKTYKYLGRDVSILDIAKHFESRGILQSLKDISRYITIH